MRSVAAVISGNSGSSRTGLPFVLRAKAVYRGLATKVISVGPASSIPLTPVISTPWSPRSSAPKRLASSPSFIEGIVPERGCPILVAPSRVRLRSETTPAAQCCWRMVRACHVPPRSERPLPGSESIHAAGRYAAYLIGYREASAQGQRRQPASDRWLQAPPVHLHRSTSSEARDQPHAVWP